MNTHIELRELIAEIEKTLFIISETGGHRMKETTRSQQYFEKALQLIPGGVNSPVRAFTSVNRTPLFIKRAKGCTMYDVDGNEYLDFVNSWGPMLLGHLHEEVREAALLAIEEGTSFGAPTRQEIELAQRIVDMVYSIDMVRLVNSGTEATMTAIRLARAFTGREKIIKIEGCYHGHGDSFLMKAGSGAMTLGVPNSPGVPKSIAQDTLIAPYNDARAIETLYEAYPEQIAALIIEPVPANMGVILPREDYLRDIRRITQTHNSLLIFDEVITGFRVANGGAQEYFGVYPDVTALGKIIGGGFPIGAYGGSKDIMEMMSPNGPVYQAGTLSGNPVAVSAGNATLRTIQDENVIMTLNQKAQSFFSEVNAIIQSSARNLCANSIASMGTLFFQHGPVTNSRQASQSDTAQFAEFFGKMLDQGVYLAPSQFEAMFISSAHTDAILEDALAAIKKALS